MSELTHAEAEMVMNLWQSRLGMSEYEIVIEISDKPVTDDEPGDVGGSCKYNAQSVRARIVLPPAVDDDNNDRISNYDAERVIVHELLHIKLGPTSSPVIEATDRLSPDLNTAFWNMYYEERERFIDSLAINLVRSWPK